MAIVFLSLAQFPDMISISTSLPVNGIISFSFRLNKTSLWIGPAFSLFIGRLVYLVGVLQQGSLVDLNSPCS